MTITLELKNKWLIYPCYALLLMGMPSFADYIISKFMIHVVDDSSK